MVYNTKLLGHLERTGEYRLDEDAVVWLIRDADLVSWLGKRLVIKLCGLSFRLCQWLNLRGARKFNRELPWVSRIRRRELQGEEQASSSSHVKRARP